MSALIDDEHWMRRALELADCAEQQAEVPVGAIVVHNQMIIGEGWNQPIQSHDPTAHAEIIALRQAAQHINNYRLVGATLYVTLEPCLMCVGALVHARIARLVFATPEPRAGAAGSVFTVLDDRALNHRVTVTQGVLQDEASARLRRFFQQRR